MNDLSIKLVHLYPEDMNIYGDMGNIITLKQRCLSRNIKIEYVIIDKNTSKFDLHKFSGDFYFMGGGQDNDMYKVFDDLINNKKEFVVSEVNKNKVFLLICGAFQLFGQYFLDSEGRNIMGLGILPVETKAPGNTLQDRCLGNLVSQISPKVFDEIKEVYSGDLSDKIVGFENHVGQTYFTDKSIQPLGKVIIGKGNNSVMKEEGAIFKNVYGSYSHGSLLPKNPHIADLLISKALETKYGKKISLEKLDDKIEWLAHSFMQKKLLT